MIENVGGLKEIGLPQTAYAAQLNLIEVISKHIQEVNDNVEAMIQERKLANKIEDARERADAYCNKIKMPIQTFTEKHCIHKKIK